MWEAMNILLPVIALLSGLWASVGSCLLQSVFFYCATHFLGMGLTWNVCVATCSRKPVPFLACTAAWEGSALGHLMFLLWLQGFHVPETHCRVLSATCVAALPGSASFSGLLAVVAAWYDPAYPLMNGNEDQAEDASVMADEDCFIQESLVCSPCGRGLVQDAILDGKNWTAVATCGDGACALHSVWGTWQRIGEAKAFYSSSARDHLEQSIPEAVDEILASGTGAMLEEVLAEHRNDLVAYAVARVRGQDETAAEARGSSIVWLKLPDTLRAELQEHAERKVIEDSDLRSREDELLNAAAALFLPTCVPLVRELCVFLGYVTEEEAQRLGEVWLHDDPREDPLELFQSCQTKPQVSRFDVLFQPEVEEARTARRSFFLNTVYNSSTGGPNSLSQKLDFFLLDCLSREQLEWAQILMPIITAVKHRHDFQLLPDASGVMTSAILWEAVRAAWSEDAYWFSVSELYWICAWCGPAVRVYQCLTDAVGTSQWTLYESQGAAMASTLAGVVRVSLEYDPMTGCGHFSRLLSPEELATLREGESESSASSEHSSSASSEDESESDSERENVHDKKNDDDPPGSDSRATPTVLVDGEFPDSVAENEFSNAKQNGTPQDETQDTNANNTRDMTEQDSEAQDVDSLSEGSDGPDPSDVRVDPEILDPTREDKDLARAEEIKALLRERPLWPADPQDTTKAYTDVHSGVRCPILHCAFQDCTWHADEEDFPELFNYSMEYRLYQHLIATRHGHAEVFEPELRKVTQLNMPVHAERETLRFFLVYSMYMLAVHEKEREGMMLVGLTKDRQIHRGISCVMQHVQAKICFCCAQTHTCVPLWERMAPRNCGRVGAESHSGISHFTVQEALVAFYHRDQHNFHVHLGLEEFKRRYCAEAQPGGNPFHDDTTFTTATEDWRQTLVLPRSGDTIDLLCCPEDVIHCPKCASSEKQLCQDCHIPLCRECAACIVHNASPGSPMALCNDNFWGYTTDLIYKYKVTWLEAAIVQPCWTSMLVCYIEGTRGHLMNEDLYEQQFRTRVRGAAHSFLLPWEEVLAELENHQLKNMAEILPRRPECLKYILRVHLRVGQRSMDKVMRQLTVRPFVLLQLLYFLVERRPAMWREQGSLPVMKQQLAEAVRRHYPVAASEQDRPVEKQEWTIPPDLLEVATEFIQDKNGKTKEANLIKDKCAVPGTGGITEESIVEDTRPSTVSAGLTTQSYSDPASMRTGALMRHGTLRIQTSETLMSQWHSLHFAEILPFVIPFMVSGPDYAFYQAKKRGRRGTEDDPYALWVSPLRFVAAVARRCESQMKRDWCALPIMRSICFKHAVETDSSSCLFHFARPQGGPAELKATKYAAMVKKLYETLWKGHVRYGNIRVPLNGDVTRLAQAEGLSPEEKHMARRIHYKAQHYPGTQQVRQLMGHSHWGARIVYGDTLFFTISVNENHSAWVLRLSRNRRNDPCLEHADPVWKELCAMDYPAVASSRCTDDEIVIDLPEYDVRRLATARDPLAVVEAHRLNICLRLAWLLGVRMCPQCPKCNAFPWGCQDLFGSNMRPMGGLLGGCAAFGLGTEHQGQGTPHGHGQAHLVCIYQYATLLEIATLVEESLQKSKESPLVKDMRAFQKWLHAEEVLDPEEYAKEPDMAEREFWKGYAGKEHAAMSQIPTYLMEDALHAITTGEFPDSGAEREFASDRATGPVQTLGDAYQDRSKMAAIIAEGAGYATQYLRDAQYIFNRVQYHVHQKQADGSYLPLNACAKKHKKTGKSVKKQHCKCKHDFPKDNVLSDRTVLVCQGLAKKFRLHVKGKRNAYGLWLGQRSCMWQSGTTPGFAVHFRSNTHTMPNYRLPVTSAVHEPSCRNAQCLEQAKALLNKVAIKAISRVTQRVQRETTGYYCGYTFKGQVVGRKYCPGTAKKKLKKATDDFRKS